MNKEEISAARRLLHALEAQLTNATAGPLTTQVNELPGGGYDIFADETAVAKALSLSDAHFFTTIGNEAHSVLTMLSQALDEVEKHNATHARVERELIAGRFVVTKARGLLHDTDLGNEDISYLNASALDHLRQDAIPLRDALDAFDIARGRITHEAVAPLHEHSDGKLERVAASQQALREASRVREALTFCARMEGKLDRRRTVKSEHVVTLLGLLRSAIHELLAARKRAEEAESKAELYEYAREHRYEVAEHELDHALLVLAEARRIEGAPPALTRAIEAFDEARRKFPGWSPTRGPATDGRAHWKAFAEKTIHEYTAFATHMTGQLQDLIKQTKKRRGL